MATLPGFATIVSELMPELKRFAPTRVLAPLLIGATTIALVGVYVFGGERLEQEWNDRNALERLLTTALVIFAFYVLALLMTAFQPALVRLYQGHYPGSSLLRTWYLHEWQRRMRAEREWERLFHDVRDSNLDFSPIQSRGTPPSKDHLASRTYGRFELIRNEAWARVTSPAVAVAARTIDQGEEPDRSSWFSIPDETWLEGMAITALCLSPSAVWPDLSAGQIMVASLPDGEVVNKGGSVVLDVKTSDFAPTVTVIVAAAPPVCRALKADESRLGLVRKTSGLTFPVWENDPAPQSRTRRWFPAVALPDLAPGDYVDIKLNAATIGQSIYCGPADQGGVWAIPLVSADALPDTPVSATLPGDPSTFTFYRVATSGSGVGFKYPVEIGESSHISTRTGRVRAGTLIDDESRESIDDFVPATFDLSRSCLNPGLDEHATLRFADLRPSTSETNAGYRVAQLLPECVRPSTMENIEPNTRATLVSQTAHQQSAMVAELTPVILLAPASQPSLILLQADDSKNARVTNSEAKQWLVLADLREWIESAGAPAEFRVLVLPVRNGIASPHAEHLVIFGYKDQHGDCGGAIPVAFDAVALPPETSASGDRNIIVSRNSDQPGERWLASAGTVEFVDRENLDLRKPDVDIDDDAPFKRATVALLDYEIAIRLNDRKSGQAPLAADSRTFGEHFEHLYPSVVNTLDLQRKAFRLQFPRHRDEVAPTKLGNVIAAVHSYANETYGIDATLVLPRLSTVLSTGAKQRIQDAEERMALIMWSGFIAIVTGIAGSLLFAYGMKPLESLAMLIGSLVLFGFLIYPAAVSSALAYGDQLRIAFDSERGAVLKMLGIALPGDEASSSYIWKEADIWSGIGQWWEYGYMRKVPPEYTIPGASAPPESSS